MFLPIFIAILLGLVDPATTNTTDNGSVTTMNAPTPDIGEDGTPGGDTGGESGHIPPKKP